MTAIHGAPLEFNCSVLRELKYDAEDGPFATGTKKAVFLATFRGQKVVVKKPREALVHGVSLLFVREHKQALYQVFILRDFCFVVVGIATRDCTRLSQRGHIDGATQVALSSATRWSLFVSGCQRCRTSATVEEGDSDRRVEVD